MVFGIPRQIFKLVAGILNMIRNRQSKWCALTSSDCSFRFQWSLTGSHSAPNLSWVLFKKKLWRCREVLVILILLLAALPLFPGTRSRSMSSPQEVSLNSSDFVFHQLTVLCATELHLPSCRLCTLTSEN